jgi:hypothetical protein
MPSSNDDRGGLDGVSFAAVDVLSKLDRLDSGLISLPGTRLLIVEFAGLAFRHESRSARYVVIFDKDIWKVVFL